MNDLFAGVARFFRLAACGLLACVSAERSAAAPSVSSAPPARQVLAPGQELRLEVQAEGSGISYSWRKDGRLLAGEQGPVLTRGAVSRADAGCYVVELRDEGGDVVRCLAFVGVAPKRTQVVSVGSHLRGLGDVPAGLDDVIEVFARHLNAAALRADGSVSAWGDNFGHKAEPPTGLAEVVSVAVGGSHMLALKADGTVVAWGSNDHGQSTVPADLREVIAVAAGSGFTLALRADGTVVGWGLDDEYAGRLKIPAGLSDVASIAASTGGAVAVTEDGTLVPWGERQYGGAVPVDLGAVVSVVAGRSGHGYPYWLALLADGTVRGWGSSVFGAQEVPAGLHDVVAIAADGDLGAARRSDGQVVVWGNEEARNRAGAAIWADAQSVALAVGQIFVLRDAENDVAPKVIVQPVGRTLEQGEDLELRVVASGQGALSYQWRHNGVAIPGATEARYFRERCGPGQGGYYDVLVRNAAGRVGSAKVEVVVTLADPVRLNSVQQIHVSTRIFSGLVVDTELAGGARYFAQGLPPGLKLNPRTGEVTGRITGKPGSYVVKFHYTVGGYRSPRWTQELQVLPFPDAVAGAFEAILYKNGGVPAAKIEVRVAPGGAYTGRLVLVEDGKDYAFRGAVDISGAWLAVGENRIERGKGRPALLLGFNTMDDDEYPFVASLEAEDGSSWLVEYGVRLRTFAKGESFAHRGAFTALFEPPTDGSGALVSAGSGYATARADGRARYVFRGRLADNSVFTAKVVAGADDSLRILARPNGRAGALVGGVFARDADFAEDLVFHAAAFVWSKPPRPADKLYPMGLGPWWTEAKLARWRPPSRDVGLRERLGTEASAGSIPFGIAGTLLDADSIQLLPEAVEMLESGRMSGAAERPGQGFAGRLDRSTGLVSGQLFVVLDGRSKRLPFLGVFLQPDGSDPARATVGGGFGILPAFDKSGGEVSSVGLRFGR